MKAKVTKAVTIDLTLSAEELQALTVCVGSMSKDEWAKAVARTERKIPLLSYEGLTTLMSRLYDVQREVES